MTLLDQIAPYSACYKNNFFHVSDSSCGGTLVLNLKAEDAIGERTYQPIPTWLVQDWDLKQGGLPSLIHRPLSLTSVSFIAGCASVSEIGQHLVQFSRL